MKRSAILVLLAILALSAVGSVSAEGGTSINISGIVPNPCTGEDVYFSGTVYITQVYDADGTHLIANVSYSNVLGTGVTTGKLYKYVGETSQMVNQDSDLAPLTSTVQQKIRWVTAGGQNDLTIRIFQHITWNANGYLAAYSYEFGDYTCS